MDKKTIRKPNRLPLFDYGQNGTYFITICTHKKQNLFWESCRDNPCGCPSDPPIVEYTLLGQIAIANIKALEERFPIKIENFVVMPNHIHLLIYLDEHCERTAARAVETNRTAARAVETNRTAARAVPTTTPQIVEPNRTAARAAETNRTAARAVPTTIPQIVGAYKSIVSTQYLSHCKSNKTAMGNLWQRSYYDHIVRNEKDFLTKWNYIEGNIAEWTKDQYY